MYSSIDSIEGGRPAPSSPQTRAAKSNLWKTAALSLLIVVLCVLTFGIQWKSDRGSKIQQFVSDADQEALFDAEGRFVMKDFDRKKPLSNFLPGIAGLFGIPMWAFFVNRGQCIAGFGVKSKDGSIMKFNSAEKAYQATSSTGFRTFVKGSVGSRNFQVSPFARKDGFPPSRSMMSGASELEIEEVDPEIELQTNVLYFTITDESFPALVRQTTFKNLNTLVSMRLEVLDGLARLEPSGLSNNMLDALGRTMEGVYTN